VPGRRPKPSRVARDVRSSSFRHRATTAAEARLDECIGTEPRALETRTSEGGEQQTPTSGGQLARCVADHTREILSTLSERHCSLTWNGECPPRVRNLLVPLVPLVVPRSTHDSWSHGGCAIQKEGARNATACHLENTRSCAAAQCGSPSPAKPLADNIQKAGAAAPLGHSTVACDCRSPRYPCEPQLSGVRGCGV